VHYGSGLPFRAIPALKVGPLISRFEIVVVIGRKVLNLLFAEVGSKIVFMFRGGTKAIGRQQKLFGHQPSSAIDHRVLNVSRGMIEDHVIYLAQFLALRSVECCSAYIFGGFAEFVISLEVRNAPWCCLLTRVSNCILDATKVGSVWFKLQTLSRRKHPRLRNT